LANLKLIITWRFFLEAKAFWEHTCIAGGLFLLPIQKESNRFLSPVALQYFVNYFLLELTVLSSFLNRNSNARIYRIRWRFCCLYVSYSSIFIPIQHFSRLI